MRRFLISTVLLMSALVTGCANLVAPPYSADFAAVDALKRSGANKLTMGKVQPEDPSAKANASISLRSASLTAGDTSFSGYLERAMTSDLRDAGLLDPASKTKIELVLLQNDINVVGVVEGNGTMSVDLSVTSAGKLLLRKGYSANTKFESSFFGSTAVAKGQSEYPNLVRALLSTIYRDAAFVQAITTR